jgi:hypothetical protein
VGPTTALRETASAKPASVHSKILARCATVFPSACPLIRTIVLLPGQRTWNAWRRYAIQSVRCEKVARVTGSRSRIDVAPKSRGRSLVPAGKAEWTQFLVYFRLPRIFGPDKARLMPRKKQSALTDAAKPMPAPSANAQHGSKSAFVRNLPQDLPAKEVVAKAKAEGIKLSIAQVYNIRSTSKRKGTIKSTPRPAVKSSSSGRAPVEASDSETRLRKLIAEVGLARSRAVLAEVGAAFAG